MRNVQLGELENLNKLKQDECALLFKENTLLSERNQQLTDMN